MHLGRTQKIDFKPIKVFPPRPNRFNRHSFLPEWGAGGQYVDTDSLLVETLNVVDEDNVASVLLSVSQLIYDFGKKMA